MNVIQQKIARALAVAGLALVGVAGLGQQASALPTLYYLNGATFDDGGTATGSFVIDAYGFLSAPAAISTTGGTTLGPYSYDLSNPTDTGPNYIDFFSPTYNRDLHIAFDEPFLSGLASAIDYAASYECAAFSCPGPTGAGGDTRFFVTGSLNVPEPASMSMFGIGMIALLAARRRTRA